MFATNVYCYVDEYYVYLTVYIIVSQETAAAIAAEFCVCHPWCFFLLLSAAEDFVSVAARYISVLGRML